MLSVYGDRTQTEYADMIKDKKLQMMQTNMIMLKTSWEIFI